MRVFLFLLPLFACTLTACAIPSRDTFAPAAAGPDTATISATEAFAGRIPYVTILPGTTDFPAPLAKAVHAALAIKPAAKFEVQAQTPVGAAPDASAATLSSLSPTATAVAKSIISDGVAPQNVSLTAKTAGLNPAILVYVK
jgi:hypothetical protein